MRSEFGKDYRCAIQHLDEAYPHLHVYAVRPDFDAKQNHPGYRAQKEALATGCSSRQVEIAGALALKDFLDRYHDEVDQP